MCNMILSIPLNECLIWAILCVKSVLYQLSVLLCDVMLVLFLLLNSLYSCDTYGPWELQNTTKLLHGRVTYNDT